MIEVTWKEYQTIRETILDRLFADESLTHIQRGKMMDEELKKYKVVK